MLARNSLFACMRCKCDVRLSLNNKRFLTILKIFLAQNISQEHVDHKWAQLESLGTMLTGMSKEHHEIAIQIKASSYPFHATPSIQSY